MKALSVVLLFLCLCLLPFTTFAEVKIFVHTVRQPFSGSQSPDDARVAATHKAKREVLEKAGTYLETLTIVEKGRLTKEQIVALASGVLKTEIISQKPYTSGEGYGVIVKVMVKIDTGQVEQNLKRLMNDKMAMKQLVELRKRDKELLDRIKRLEKANRKLPKKKETQTVKKKKGKLKKDFRQTTKGLDAVALRDQALKLWKDGKYSNPRRVIELLDDAIELDPGYADAYLTRGLAYKNLKQYTRAIQDYNKAIEFDPGYELTYHARGIEYANLNQHIKAIQDYDKAIELNPGYANAYNSRGFAYANLNQHIKAIQDYDKVIELDPNNGMAYNNRGVEYNDLNQPIKAIQDLNKAIELDPNNGMAYNNRGIAYLLLKRDARGCADLEKARDLGVYKGWKTAIKQGRCY